jgi:hypothetical protein
MGIVRESLNFQRGLSDEQIRDVLFGKYHKGQILGNDVNKQFHNAWNVWLYMYLGEEKETDEFKVLYIGRIQVRGAKAHIDPFYFAHRLGREGEIELKGQEFLRELSPKEKEQVEKALLSDPKSQKGLSIAKEITGLTPKL